MYRDQIDEQADPYDVDQRYLEPVQEEYLQSEIETPVEFPEVMHRNEKQSSVKGQNLSRTQPVSGIGGGGHQYNTINTTSVAAYKNQTNFHSTSEHRLPSANGSRRQEEARSS